MSTSDASVPRKRRPKKVLSASAEYEIWLQLVRGEATIGQAATTAGVDRSTIIRVRQVAKDGALAALAASRPGTPGKNARDVEPRRPTPRSTGSARRSRSWRSS